MCAALGGGEVQFKTFDRLSGVENQFQAAGRQFRGGHTVVGAVPPIVDRGVLFLGDQLGRFGKGARLPPLFFAGRSFVPQIAAIERKAQRLLFAPQQATH